uniref:Uncharacterized protein n=1 Tax=viral metagenome TaxID=1070528 RepID=A0A6C0ES48_9ZZZZ
MKKICNTNCVYNLQQSGISKKMLISQMLRSRTNISYDNSRTSSYYITILSLDYANNKALLLILKYKVYMLYFNKLVSCGKTGKQIADLYDMIESILGNLTTEEYNIVYGITTKDITIVTSSLTITKVFYVVTMLITNNPYFIIKNYQGEYLSAFLNYEFNLEDPSNLNTKFCLSINKDGTPFNNLIYNGIPGTTGSNVVLQMDKFPNYYCLYIYNLISLNNQYYWGYYNKFIPVVTNIVNYIFSYTTLAVNQDCYLVTYENEGPSYSISNTLYTRFSGSINYKYMFNYGTYYLRVPKTFAVALLNNGQQNSIQYTGNQLFRYSSNVVSTVSDGSYFFYYDIVKITIYEPFTPISLYSYSYGYLKSFNSVIFGQGPSQPEIHKEHNLNGTIETLYSQTRVGLINNMITLNNDVNYNYNLTTTQYGVYQGTYIFYSVTPITFLNKGKENLVTITGETYNEGIGPDSSVYKFYSGVFVMRILGNFGTLSIFTFYKNYAGGRNLLVYGSAYDNKIPHSYTFTDTINTITNDPIVVLNTSKVALNSYTGQTSVLVSDQSYNLIQFINNVPNIIGSSNIITLDSLNKFVINGYNSTNLFTMLKGTYIFYSSTPIAFMNKYNTNISYVGSLFNTSKNNGPDGAVYDFYWSDFTNYYRNPIVVTVTSNFGYMSICSTSGYKGGQNLLYGF